jgi:hypothetical protein
MDINFTKTNIFAIVLTGIALLEGCNSGSQKKPDATADLGPTIGSLVDFVYPDSIPLQSYGLVGGLRNTGSRECPPVVRDYLTKALMKDTAGMTIKQTDSLIDSLETAVVLVEAVMPVLTSTGSYFDVKVSVLPGTQTNSLDYGWLYMTELQLSGTFGLKMETLANVKGPLFFDKLNPSGFDKKVGYILAGGKALPDYKITLKIKKPDFIVADQIRNRLNTRFGRDIAKASSSSQIELGIPDKYKDKRAAFISLVKSIYVADTPQLNVKRSQYYAKQLLESAKKQESETELQAIGVESLAELSVLVKSDNPEIRFRAARCTLNLGDAAGLPVLRQIALDEKSPYRIEAIEAIAFAASQNEAIMFLQRLLRDNDINVRIAAYEQLRKLGDNSIIRDMVAGSFYLEQIAPPGQKAIYVTRSGQPKIVLFGAPINCQKDTFIESADGDIIINSQPDQNNVVIIRKHPKRPGAITQLKCTYELGDIIQTLCQEPVANTENIRVGLGVPYSDVIALLKQMVDKGAVNAQFVAGPPPKIDLNVKK